jgi:protein tyrosine/serine phosphatase
MASLASHIVEAAAPTAPSPPFINVHGVPNFRDIGGYPITNSSSTRRHFIFRSALPTRITADGLKTLIQDLRVSTIYDLRSNDELRKESASLSSPSLLVSTDIQGEVKVLHTPIFPEKDTSPEQLAKRFASYMSDQGTEGFVAAYAEILRDGADAYRKIFEHVRDRPQDPLLIHCTGGKDRTGVIVALLLLVAGVGDRDLIAEEYSLTEKGFDAKVKAALTEKVIKDMGVSAENRAGIERLLSARKENMRATLEYIEEKYGGAEGYLKSALGFQVDDIARIRKNLVVEEKGILQEL